MHAQHGGVAHDVVELVALEERRRQRESHRHFGRRRGLRADAHFGALPGRHLDARLVFAAASVEHSDLVAELEPQHLREMPRLLV